MLNLSCQSGNRSNRFLSIFSRQLNSIFSDATFPGDVFSLRGTEHSNFYTFNNNPINIYINLQSQRLRIMATPVSKLDHFKLETRFGDGFVENSTYEWKYSTKRAAGLKRWERVKMIGAGAFGSVWLEKEQTLGQLRAVKMIQRHAIDTTGFSQELAALITLSDVCTPFALTVYHLRRYGFSPSAFKSPFRSVLRYLLFQQSHLFVQFLGWFENANEIFLAMEYINEGDLSGYMADHELAKSNAAEITKQILEGLQVLHDEGICHRDLKPQVLFLTCT